MAQQVDRQRCEVRAHVGVSNLATLYAALQEAASRRGLASARHDLTCRTVNASRPFSGKSDRTEPLPAGGAIVTLTQSLPLKPVCGFCNESVETGSVRACIGPVPFRRCKCAHLCPGARLRLNHGTPPAERRPLDARIVMNDKSPGGGAPDARPPDAASSHSGGTKDGEGAADHDMPYSGNPGYLFSVNERLRLLLLRGAILDSRLGQGRYADDLDSA